MFGPDGRMALPGSLHRISRLEDPRTGSIHGLTMRVGRHVRGTASIMVNIHSETSTTQRDI
jgi:hypothetical protein